MHCGSKYTADIEKDKKVSGHFPPYLFTTLFEVQNLANQEQALR